MKKFCVIILLLVNFNSNSTSIIHPNFLVINNGFENSEVANCLLENNAAPIASCVADFTIQLDAFGNATIVAADIDNGSTVDSGLPILSIDVTSFDCSDIGTPITVTLTVEDSLALGITDTCTATVTVEDNVDPTAICQDITVQLDASGNATITAAQIDNGSNDACGINALALDITSFNCTNIGANTVTLTVTDNNTNTSTCTATVTVEDNVDPTAICQDITVQLDAAGNATIVAADIDNGSNDACGINTLALDITTFDCNDIGANTVTLTVTDNNTNTSTCTATVTVEDNVDPTAICQDITVQLDASGNATITAAQIDNGSNDACGINALALDITTFDCNDIGANTVILTVTDNNTNTAQCTATVTVEDNVDPTIPTLPIITAQCSTTVPVPTIADNCNGSITGTTSDSLTYNTQGAFAITWNFDDGNGNDIDVVQNVIINDTTNPVAICQDITIQLNDTSGTASITANQINNGSTDNCGTVNLTLSKTNFDCTNIGTNVIVLTVDDGNNNSSTCTATVTVVSPNISGGTITGYLNNTETITDADDLIEVTACPDEPQNATFALSGYSGNIIRWESSINGGLNWTAIANTTNAYYYANILETTLIRAVIQIGSCQATSTIVRVVVIPPNVPPTIIGPDTFAICLGESFTVEAESSFGININLEEGGDFNTANLNNLGWLVDGDADFSAGGNSTSPTKWKGTNGPKQFGTRCYDTTDGKFAIAYGVNYPTTLETPIFNTLGLSTATLEFDQAYYLTLGASCKVELSLDSGATYPITLDPGPTYNYTGPSDSGFIIQNMQGNSCDNTPSSFVDKHVSMDLQNYIGLVGLRIKFTLNGNTESTWALENIIIPQAPVNEVIEWTDGNGTVVTTGSTTTITPITPGTQNFGVTSLINECRADGPEGTEFISVDASLAYAGKDIEPVLNECGKLIVTLKAYDNEKTALENYNNDIWEQGLYIYPGESYDHDNDVNTANIIALNDYSGTGMAGVWTVVNTNSSCGGNYSFSNSTNNNPLGDPGASFNADPGTYTLRWTLSNGCFDEVDVTIDSCQSLDFDGINDYISFGNNYGDLGNSFSIETWVKPVEISGTHTIISKRRKSNTNRGYDLSVLSNGRVQFNWYSTGSNDGAIESQYSIDTSRWFHIAVTFNGTYNLYIDGIDVGTISGTVSSPQSAGNNHESLVGAIDTTNNGPTDFYKGWIDEIRIWNTAITQNQIRQMMNQEIIDNTSVRGEVVPLDVSGLSWSNLEGYYRMQVNCGYLTPFAGSIRGNLRNMNSVQQETAPLPYTSRVDGQNWSTDNTWTHFNVWDAPNSLGIDNSTPIDWNIVQISHNINSGNKDIIVLGLISDTQNKELRIANSGGNQDYTNTGQSIRVTHYLELDGDIDLVGESQLLQDEGSILADSSLGKLERDQQGTINLFNYNYWSSPVTIKGSPNFSDYTISGVLRDGTVTNVINNADANPLKTINWIGGYDGTATNPLSLANYWLWSYDDEPENSYSAWHPVGSSGSLKLGLGFTMKGSGAATTIQNYVFEGKPNNGTIINSVSAGYQTLVGNPYPSAIDANEFIDDNGPLGTNSIDGVLYFWEHFTSNVTHILEDYEGGYAAYNKIGGVPPYIPVEISGNGSFSKTPGRYVPVAQGFFVTASSNGGNINFYNDQRIFVREATGTSVFMEANNEVNEVISSTNSNNPNTVDEDIIKRIRLEFNSSDTFQRQLLLGFAPNKATDGLDYGYDALISDIFSNDMSWLINEGSYGIQGVGEFDYSKQYPLGIYIANSGTIKIALNDLENFNETIDVYIYDSLLGNYTQINNSDFEIALDSGDYLNRFYLTFSNQDELNVIEHEINNIVVNYLNNTHEIYINTFNKVKVQKVQKVQVVNMLGQLIKSWDKFQLQDSAIRIPVEYISSGNYIIKVESENNKLINKKIVISR